MDTTNTEVAKTSSPSSNRLHPLVAGAAVAVILASLIGVAAMTGLLPSSNSANAPQHPQQISQDAPAASPQDSRQQLAANTAPARVAAEQPAAAAPAICSTCGEVVNVRAVTNTPSGSGVGIAGGAVVGGLLGNQVGGGTGRTLATIAGAVGGGYAGNVVEKRVRTTTSHVVEVRMENGKTRSFPQTNENWRVGDRVRVVNGHLEGRG
ncbi:glycine zipper 2TM domain-containing protein [Herbaspirillum sp. alder98]|uniref:glycine zipper 2TM domain-containing protein n=1 Tax=Herbaspirillum sp. alder98 TaxID=2913096 RepID=UPI001CD8A595|nr:glycine zipper 2TM domain-containing protein [Herbaspirillum sp. alder98]MCA1326665.1 glycine zipper 2TM domain-containing protein [Herbaspirillum sp. alder98]